VDQNPLLKHVDLGVDQLFCAEEEWWESHLPVADLGIVQDGVETISIKCSEKNLLYEKTELGENNIQIIMRILFIQALHIY
jgi:hypothetical protein